MLAAWIVRCEPLCRTVSLVEDKRSRMEEQTYLYILLSTKFIWIEPGPQPVKEYLF